MISAPDLRIEKSFVHIFGGIEKLDYVRFGWVFASDIRTKLTQYAAGPGRLAVGYISVSPPVYCPHPVRLFYLDCRRNPADGIGKPDSVNVCSPLGIEPRCYTLPKPTVYTGANGKRPEHDQFRQLLDQYRGHWHNHAAMHGYHIGDYQPEYHVPVFGLDL